MTLDTRVELDQEKANCLALEESLSQSKHEIGVLKERLERTRNDLRNAETKHEGQANEARGGWVVEWRKSNCTFCQVESSLLLWSSCTLQEHKAVT